MFSGGKLDISVEKTGYAPGDTISGTVTLTLKKPVKAREMTLSLSGEYITTVTARVIGPVPSARPKGGLLLSRGRMLQSNETRKIAPIYHYKKSTETVRISGFKEQLDGEGEYSQSRSYDIRIKIPTDTATSSVVNWYLLAKLDVPHGRDVTKKVPITIG
jgi:hypothetical protein